MKRFAQPLVVCILMFSIAQPAFAAKPILDQFNAAVHDSSLNGGASPYNWQQGVTAGISGQLTRIDLHVRDLDANSEMVATELSVWMGPPWQSGAPVWTITVVPVAGWNTFDLKKEKIFVVAGDEFTIGIHGTSAYNFDPGFVISYGDQYPGGDLYLNGTLNSDVNDVHFRTYVKPHGNGGK